MDEIQSETTYTFLTNIPMKQVPILISRILLQISSLNVLFNTLDMFFGPFMISID